MLIAIVILSLCLLLSLSLTYGYRKAENSLLRVLERQRIQAAAREAELTDKILSMKGYREFNPVTTTRSEPSENEQGNIEWQEISLLEEQGFRPL